MSNRKRLFFEVVAAVFLALLCVALWNSARARGEQRLTEATAAHESAMAELRRQCDAQAEQLADS
jgi:hypothetical protein